MDEYRLKISIKPTPTSHYYCKGKLGILKSDDMVSFDKAFET